MVAVYLNDGRIVARRIIEQVGCGTTNTVSIDNGEIIVEGETVRILKNADGSLPRPRLARVAYRSQRHA